jgi:hypothetical protein
MEFGQRADAVVTEEFVFVEHALEDFLKSVLANDGEEDSITLASSADARHVPLRKIASVLDEPVHTLLEARKFVDELWLKSCRSVEWNQADQ